MKENFLKMKKGEKYKREENKKDSYGIYYNIDGDRYEAEYKKVYSERKGAYYYKDEEEDSDSVDSFGLQNDIYFKTRPNNSSSEIKIKKDNLVKAYSYLKTNYDKNKFIDFFYESIEIINDSSDVEAEIKIYEEQPILINEVDSSKNENESHKEDIIKNNILSKNDKESQNNQNNKEEKHNNNIENNVQDIGKGEINNKIDNTVKMEKFRKKIKLKL